MAVSQSTRKVRVCCLCETWESGGIEAFLFNVICHMDRTGLEIDIVAAKLGESIFSAPLKECGVRFYQLSGCLYKLETNHRLFQRLLAERQYDAVHLNAYQALSLAYLRQAKMAGVPVRISHSHNTMLRKSLTKPLKLSLHYWAREHYKDVMTHRWACSKAAAEFLFGADNAWCFIPNGIDIGRFQFNPKVREEVRRKLGLEGKLVVGNVGRLCYQKNQMFLLDVFQVLHKIRPESVLLLVGEGEDRSRLKKKTEALQLENSVILYGTTDAVEQLFWTMDVFAFPSLFEGLGIAAVEAQAAGLRVVCSEYVPEAVQVTERVQMVPLSSGPEVWAKKLLECSTENKDCSLTEVQNAGFSAEDVAEKIKEKWTEMTKK